MKQRKESITVKRIETLNVSGAHVIILSGKVKKYSSFFTYMYKMRHFKTNWTVKKCHVSSMAKKFFHSNTIDEQQPIIMNLIVTLCTPTYQLDCLILLQENWSHCISMYNSLQYGQRDFRDSWQSYFGFFFLMLVYGQCLLIVVSVLPQQHPLFP